MQCYLELFIYGKKKATLESAAVFY